MFLQVSSLTTGPDNLPGTSAADNFSAPLSQVSDGTIANTLASGDVINGGAGEDTLRADVIREATNNNGGGNIDIQPTTVSIETVTFENRDDVGSVTVDAKRMSGVDTIGSLYSDGDLVIENLTTLENDQIRLTSDMTITMAYTDNFNTDADASDLSVYFDEDYLNTSVSNSGSRLEIKLVNAVTNVVGGNPLFGTDSFSFSFDGTEIEVDISEIAADDTLDFSTAYQAVADLITEQLAEDYPTLVVTLGAERNAAFSIDLVTADATYQPGDAAGVYFPILITNSGPEELAEGSFQQAQVEADTNIAANQDDSPATEVATAISINVDLEKVGRDGEGGNLIIGGKNSDATGDTDVDQNDGIAVFNINVIGDSDKPSNLGQITSTNGALTTVNISTDSGENAEDGYAALTVRGETAAGVAANPFGGALSSVNANGFLGDLAVGTLTANNQVSGLATLINTPTFTALGGGDVTLAAAVGVTAALANSPLRSTATNAFTIATGAGDDTIGANAKGGAQLTVVTGAGDDTVFVDLEGTDNSGSTDTTVTISAAGGDNTIEVDSLGGGTAALRATVVTGAGSDVVTGNDAGLTVLTGAGDDVIFAENTGATAVATIADGTYDTAITAGPLTGMRLSNFLNGREVTITVAMPEENTSGTGEAVDFVNGYELETFVFQSAAQLSTEVELYRAVANAINSDATINKLVTASVSSTGNLSIAYAIDGSTTNGEELVEINISDEYAVAGDIPDALLSAVQAAMSNSAITAADVLTQYDAATTAHADNYATTSGGTSASVTFDLTSFTDADDITIGIDGVAVTLFDVGGAAAEVEFNGDTFEALGTTFTVSSGGANSLTITSEAAGLDLTTVTIIDETLGAAVAGTVTDGTLGTNGSDSASDGINIVNAGTGDDVVVLSSNDASFDQVIFSAGDIGNDVIIHFETGNGDRLDFSDWLDSETSASGSSVSAQEVTITVASGLTNIVANSVVVEDFDQVQTAFGSGAITFADLTDAQLLQALNGTAAGGNAGIFENDSTSNLVGGTGKAIMLIQNDDDGDGAVDAGDNFGEYLIVEVEFTDDGAGGANNDDNFTAARIVGSIDFGETQAFNVINFTPVF